MTQAQPGWYDDPEGAHRFRWFDGVQWTAHTSDGAAPAAGVRDVGRGWFGAGRVLQGLLALCALAAISDLVVAYWLGGQVRRWAEIVPTAAELDRMVDVSNVVLWVSLSVYVATGLVFAVWIFLAHRSDRLAGDRRRHRSAWALVAWFVPFVNLVLPARVVNDVRRASDREDLPPAPLLLGAWWGTLLVAAGVNRVASSRLDRAETATAIDGALRYVIVGDLILTVCAVLAVVLVREIAQRMRTSPYAPRPRPATAS